MTLVMFLKRCFVVRIFTFLVSFSLIFASMSFVFQQGNIKPQILVKPFKSSIYYNDTVKFIRESVKIINTGGSPLAIKEVKSSCGCATAGVGRAVIHPTSIGYLHLNIDVSRLKDSVAHVEYYIYSNAEDSVLTYPVYLYKRPAGIRH